MTNPTGTDPLSLGSMHHGSHYDAYNQIPVQTEYIGQGPVIYVDPLYGRDQSDPTFTSRTAGTRDDPFKSIGTRAGASTDGAIPFGVKNGTGAANAAAFTVMVRTGARSDLTPVGLGPPPTFTDGVNKARELRIDEQINPPHGVWVAAEGSPSDGAQTLVNAAVRVIPSAVFPINTALFKVQKSSRVIGIAAVNTQTGGIGFEISGNNAQLVNCAAYQCRAQGVIATNNGNDNAAIIGGFYRANDQSNSGVAAIELFDNSPPGPTADAPNQFTIGPFVDFAGNLNGAIRFWTAAAPAAPGGVGVLIWRNRIHAGGTGNNTPLVKFQGGNRFTISENYFEPGTGTWADALVVIDKATGGATEQYWPHFWTVERNYFHGTDSATLPIGKAQWVNVLYGASGRIRDNGVGANSTDASANRPLYRFSANTRANYGDFAASVSGTWTALTLAQVVQDAGTNNYGYWHDLTNLKDAKWGTWPI